MNIKEKKESTDHKNVFYRAYFRGNYLFLCLNDGTVLPYQKNTTLLSPVMGMPVVTVECLVAGKLKPPCAMSIKEGCLYYNDVALPNLTIIEHNEHLDGNDVDTVTFSVECELINSVIN